MPARAHTSTLKLPAVQAVMPAPWCQVQSGTWKRYSAPDPVQGLLQQVKRDLSIDAATEFTRVSTRSGGQARLQALPYKALHGMHPGPQLQELLLPVTSPVSH